MARLALLFLDILFDDRLSGDGGMVGAWNPESLLALHPGITNHNILYGQHEGRTHVKDASHIRRRQNNGERLAFFAAAWFVTRQFVRIKKTALFPEFIDTLFRFNRIIRFQEFFVHVENTSRKTALVPPNTRALLVLIYKGSPCTISHLPKLLVPQRDVRLVRERASS